MKGEMIFLFFIGAIVTTAAAHVLLGGAGAGLVIGITAMVLATVVPE